MAIMKFVIEMNENENSRPSLKLIHKSNRFRSAAAWRPSGDRCALVTEILAGFGFYLFCILLSPPLGEGVGTGW